MNGTQFIIFMLLFSMDFMMLVMLRRFSIFSITIISVFSFLAVISLIPVKHNRWGIMVVSIFAWLWLVFGLVLLGGRLYYMLQNGGMEKAGGEGSPVLFLWHMMIEQIFCTGPGLLFIILCNSCLKKDMRRKTKNELVVITGTGSELRSRQENIRAGERKNNSNL